MPRELSEQVVVITGASSGIGRLAAIRFGRRGAAVVLAARNEAALRDVAEEIGRDGGRALVVPTDVAEAAQVERLAHEAVDRFRRIDTWVNNAAVSAYGTVEQLAVEEIDRIIRVDLLGTIYGTKAALGPMRRQGGGTIINVSSVLGVRAAALQAPYCAAKHGVKGFTEALRLELDRERSGIRLTLILPASIDTPFFSHARSKMGVRPKPLPPVYAPDIAAEAILFAAEHPRRDIFVGGAGKMFDVLERISPPLVDRYMLQGDRIFEGQMTDRPDDGRGNLFTHLDGPGSVTGEFGREAKPTSLYTRTLEFHPALKPVLVGAAVLGVVALVKGIGRNGRPAPRVAAGLRGAWDAAVGGRP